MWFKAARSLHANPDAGRPKLVKFKARKSDRRSSGRVVVKQKLLKESER